MNQIYISPDGNDSNPGTQAAPFCSLQKGVLVARQRREQTGRGACLRLFGGVHRLKDTLVLTSKDSGSADSPFIIEAVPGSFPVISGGREFCTWHLHDQSRRIFACDVGRSSVIRQVYINGRRAIRARSTDGTGWEKTDDGFSCPAEVASWERITDVEVVGRLDWKQYRGKISRVKDGVALMAEPFWKNSQLHRPHWCMEKVSWVENAYELLTNPGEWYHNGESGILYYMLRDDEDPGHLTVTVPFLEKLLEADGVEHIALRGLTFADATWLAPESCEGFAEVQAGVRLVGNNPDDIEETRPNWTEMPGHVVFQHARYVVIEENQFSRLGAAALRIGRGCSEITIRHNVFTDISGFAMGLGSVHDHHPLDQDIVKNNDIIENEIFNIGCEYAGSPAIVIGMTCDTRVLGNDIHDIPYSGISVGWGWGLYDDPPTIQKNIHIAENRIVSFMQELEDGGGIYNISASPGSVIEHNHLQGSRNRGPAIYLDNGSRYVTVRENVIENVIDAFSATNPPNSDNVIRENIYPFKANISVAPENEMVENHTDLNEAQADSKARIINAVRDRVEGWQRGKGV